MWGGGYQSEVTEISLVQLGGVGRRLSVRDNRDISGPARRVWGGGYQLEVTEISLVQLGCGEEVISQR